MGLKIVGKGYLNQVNKQERNLRIFFRFFEEYDGEEVFEEKVKKEDVRLYEVGFRQFSVLKSMLGDIFLYINKYIFNNIIFFK